MRPQVAPRERHGASHPRLPHQPQLTFRPAPPRPPSHRAPAPARARAAAAASSRKSTGRGGCGNVDRSRDRGVVSTLGVHYAANVRRRRRFGRGIDVAASSRPPESTRPRRSLRPCAPGSIDHPSPPPVRPPPPASHRIFSNRDPTDPRPDPPPIPRRVGDPLLDERVAALEHALGERVVLDVVVAPERAEQRPDAAPRLAAEQVGELGGLGGALGVLRRGSCRVDHRRGHREQLRADVDDPAEHRLALLELRLPAPHRVEGRASQLARAALDEAQVLRELAVLLVGARLWPSPTASCGSHFA